MSDDPKLSQRYSELPREEPPRALDDAILAASRRAMRPRRWYVPLATAAVLALAVAVTLHVQHDRPSEEVDAVAPSMKVQETPAPAPKPEAPPVRAERRVPQPFAGSPRQDSTLASPPASPPAAAAEPAPAPAPAEVQKRTEASREMAAASAGARARDERPRAQSQVTRASIAQGPEIELERIAELRAAGRHEQADKALAEFRKRYPDYRLSDEMKAKVERR